jgi:hypothetical protein
MKLATYRPKSWMSFEIDGGAKAMFAECSLMLNVHWMLPAYSLNVSWMFTWTFSRYWNEMVLVNNWRPEPTRHLLNVPWMFTECSLNVRWMSTQCSLNVPWMFTECPLNVHWMFTEYSLNDPWMFTECRRYRNEMVLVNDWRPEPARHLLKVPWISLNVHWMFPECSLNAPWMFTECSLNVPWMFPECFLNIHWMFTECRHYRNVMALVNNWRPEPARHLLNVPWMFTECS